MPGLLLSYAHSYDLSAGIKCKLYWCITTVGESDSSCGHDLMFQCCSLHTGAGRHLHLSLPDERSAASSPLPGPLHSDPHHPGGLVQGWPETNVGRRHQGEDMRITSEWTNIHWCLVKSIKLHKILESNNITNDQWLPATVCNCLTNSLLITKYVQRIDDLWSKICTKQLKNISSLTLHETALW